ncbi:MAG: hypothetical protein APR53_06995 [Methanoculleus sp. SDB]|nr:MAG: hypothetical protein APR53_06995 [Methanoculleus sp. SDB]
MCELITECRCYTEFFGSLHAPGHARLICMKNGRYCEFEGIESMKRHRYTGRYHFTLHTVNNRHRKEPFLVQPND